MVIFHGSEKIIESPVFGYGKKHNDYGIGFYCTENRNLAMEWAVEINRDGYANKYDLNTKGLSIMDLTDEKYNVLNWIAILLGNRDFSINSPVAKESKKFLLENYLPDYTNYDVIRGYRADDSYFAFAKDFLNNAISVQQLSRAMKYGNLGEQIVLKSEKAFDRIIFQESEVAYSQIWYPQKESRDVIARQQYFNENKNAFKKGEIYMLKILEEEIMADDLRI